MMKATYIDMKYLMKGKEYAFQGNMARIHHIDRLGCHTGWCNVMFEIPVAGTMTYKKITIKKDGLRKVYYNESTFDDLKTK